MLYHAKNFLTAILLSTLLVLPFTVAKATVLSFDLDYEFSGADAPAGSGPWLTATFDDSGSAGSVMLTLESHLSAAEFFHGVWFNFDPTLNAALIGVGTGTDTGWSSFIRGNDCCQADGSGLYDLNINFSNGAFGGSDVFHFELIGAGITADMFDYLNTPSGGNGTYHVAAHVGGIDICPAGVLPTAGEKCLTDGSGWIGDTGTPVPEPGSLALLGLGLLGLGLVRRKA